MPKTKPVVVQAPPSPTWPGLIDQIKALREKTNRSAQDNETLLDMLVDLHLADGHKTA